MGLFIGANTMPRGYKKTTEDFIKDARLIHGDKYDYSKTVYTVASEDVEVICSKHGSFFQKPYNHTKGSGCPKCGIETANLYGKKLRRTTEEFIALAVALHGDTYEYDEVIYIRSNLKVNIRCKIHGMFSQEANKHLQGRGCPRCKKRLVSRKNT